ncbi:hypothetical protein Pint_33180 [Pistacia integerrima]|uniref:Uncharacterized protein n=1 Tax=Pistacia integerrima TaxID=434235 RepID=A0ACC0X765_9ROSI|nr:hypothetical protein Pint_33180 [Pistacia integerrima]
MVFNAGRIASACLLRNSSVATSLIDGESKPKHVLLFDIKGESSFHLFVFIMSIAVTAARALKSVLQGILLSYEGY